jgi:hypothetical protein
MNAAEEKNAKARAKRAAQIAASGKRWCAQGMHDVDAGDGTEFQRGRVKRFICNKCQEKSKNRVSAKK